MSEEITVNVGTGEVTTREDALRALLTEWWTPPADLVATLPGRGGGPALSYLGHADTTRALIEADPAWTWEPMAYEADGSPALERDGSGNPIGMWAWITVCGVRRPCYGSCEPGKREAVKELIGDCIRNGAMRFGVAGGLWSKADRTVDDDQVRAMVAAAKESGLDADEAKRVLRRVSGADSSHEVPRDKFDAVIAAFRSHPQEAAMQMAAELGGEVVAA